jgi:hypothetical protein
MAAFLTVIASASPVAAATLTGGTAHTCMVTTAGGIRCWGDNSAGQLGSPAAGSFSSTPVDVAGLTSGVQSIAAGAAHTCALLFSGAVKCWGKNDKGQLGDGSFIDRNTPVSVFGFESGGGTGLITGGAFTCIRLGAISAGFPGPPGTYLLACFGAYGNSATPQYMITCGMVSCSGSPFSGAFIVGGSAGADASHFCISVTGTTTLTMSRNPLCFGNGPYGQLGSGLVHLEAFGAGEKHSCGLRWGAVSPEGAGIECWGTNTEGQLGAGPEITRTDTPVDVIGFPEAPRSLSAGRLFSCASGDGSRVVRCWGDNSRGQLGDGTTTRRYTAVQVLGLIGVQEVAAGSNHACARLAGNAVACWGANDRGQLGDGGTTDQAAPALIWTGSPIAPSVISAPASMTVPAGSAVLWIATALGNPAPARQWQYSADGGVTWTDIADAITPVLTFSAAAGESGRQFRAVFTSSNGSAATAPAVLTVTGDRPMSADMDGDGRGDLVIWRPSTGTWFWLMSTTSFNPAAAQVRQWGNQSLGDVPLTGDIDGDGRADLIIWRASTGTWYWLTSSSGYSYEAGGGRQWGNAALGDVPRAADFDGDGKMDLAVWRASTGTWYWLTSTSGYSYAAAGGVQWGDQSLGDRPIIGDVDGDGRSDLVVWRASTGTWHWLTSSSAYASQGAAQWGSAAYFDVHMLRDVDGDGRADLVIWRPGSGMWFWLTSSSGYSHAAAGLRQWGAQGDTPVALDGDGDGRLDPAVWRPSSGIWFWLRSTAGYDYAQSSAQQWGSAVSGRAR